ncbi:LOW QUALITY PROTEIN: connector enhancer of kinase suppressor of ras 3 [Pleuronectes platessa]|uniref:LOW QUALITY PROTEIN: connector enhancer of kinase suppressor of ras 3 n=1 Tax=Pleuronectes platessa TaxID=8262 RepID=UPI00232A3F1F|nr:LOW QUALITY PROTEIN: connector enhancer of kinase suppressor of ras 3 [Pleuronectes platessa]
MEAVSEWSPQQVLDWIRGEGGVLRVNRVKVRRLIDWNNSLDSLDSLDSLPPPLSPAQLNHLMCHEAEETMKSRVFEEPENSSSSQSSTSCRARGQKSPADRTQRIHAETKSSQVNKQTVVGWQLKHLVEALRAETGSVALVVKKRPCSVSGGFAPAPLKNLRWRAALMQTSQRSSGLFRPPQPETTGRAAMLDLYIPPPPAAPYVPTDGTTSVSPGVKLRSRSPNSCLDSDPRRRVSVADDIRTSVSPEHNQPIHVHFRQRSSSRCKPRPVSMPAEAFSGVSHRPGAQGRKGQDVLHKFLSNEGISTITEEEPCFPLPYRGHPSVRGVDHIRGSQCFINTNLHSSATIPYQEAASKKPCSSSSSSSSTSTPAAVSPPPAATKPSTSLLGGWLARLRLLSH